MIDKPHTACFSGHRDIPQEDITVVRERTEAVIESLIQKGVIYYGCGGAYGYDLLAAETVLELKVKYPHIFLIIVKPCREQTAKWKNKADIDRYNSVLERADKIKCLSEEHYSGCELERNKYLVKFSGFCICYLTKQSGGTAFTVRLAKENGLILYNVSADRQQE